MAQRRWWGTLVSASLVIVATFVMAELGPSATFASTPAEVNAITLSTSAGSVGTVVTVSGSSDSRCVGAPGVEFQPLSATIEPFAVVGFPVTPSAFWSFQFRVPAYLIINAGPTGMAVTPGEYQFISDCNAEPSATAVFTVTGVVTSRFVAMAATPTGNGYWLSQAGGGVYSYGNAAFYGSLPGLRITPAAPIVAMATTPDGRGYWLAGADGGVFAFGDARFYGSLATQGVAPTGPIVSMAAMPNGKGYWLLGADGGVFAFGSAPFYGSANANLPSGYLPGIAAPFSSITPFTLSSGQVLIGYVVSSEFESNTAFAFTNVGQSVFYAGGSLPSSPPLPPLPSPPIVGLTEASFSGSGFFSVWLAQTNGGVITDSTGVSSVPFYGSLPGIGVSPSAPIAAIVATPDHRGYWLMGADGGVFAFGDASFQGSAGGSDLPW